MTSTPRCRCVLWRNATRDGIVRESTRELLRFWQRKAVLRSCEFKMLVVQYGNTMRRIQRTERTRGASHSSRPPQRSCLHTSLSRQHLLSSPNIRLDCVAAESHRLKCPVRPQLCLVVIMYTAVFLGLPYRVDVFAAVPIHRIIHNPVRSSTRWILRWYLSSDQSAVQSNCVS